MLDLERSPKREVQVGRIKFIFIFAVVTSAAIAAGAGLPPEVADRLEKAVSLDDDGFVGTYRITISSVVQKPNGKSREESLIEAEIVNPGDGVTRRRLLKYIENGSDVTEKKRTKFERENGGGPDNGDDDEDLAEPFGSTADKYRFGAPEVRGSTVVVDFEPAAGHEDDEDIARGVIAWDKESFEPRWLEIAAIHPPKPLKELRLRMEFKEIGDNLFVSRLLTDGLAKILLLKREFHMEINFDDIRPASKDSDALSHKKSP